MINIFAHFFKDERRKKNPPLWSFKCWTLSRSGCHQPAGSCGSSTSLYLWLSLPFSDAFSLDLPFKAKLAPYLCANLLIGPTRVARMLNLSFLGFSRLSRCSLWSLSPWAQLPRPFVIETFSSRLGVFLYLSPLLHHPLLPSLCTLPPHAARPKLPSPSPDSTAVTPPTPPCLPPSPSFPLSSVSCLPTSPPLKGPLYRSLHGQRTLERQKERGKRVNMAGALLLSHS